MWGVRAPLRIVQDDALASQIARGNTSAEAELFNRHHRALVGFCRSILLDADEADEAAQAAFVKALDALRRRPLEAPLRPWLYRIAHNEAINLIRHRRRHDGLESAPAAVVPAADVAADQRERLAELVRDLQALPERQRSALLMREMSGFSYAEIATTLSASEQAVRQSVFEARQTLAEFREGRAIECSSVRSVLEAGDRRVLRGKRMRAHLRGCPDCEALRTGVAKRRRDLRLLLPALPASGLLAVVTGGGSGGIVAAGAVKLAVGSLAAVTATFGVVAIKHHHQAAPTHERIAVVHSERSHALHHHRHVAAPRVTAAGPKPTATPKRAVPTALKRVHKPARTAAPVVTHEHAQPQAQRREHHAAAPKPVVTQTPAAVATDTPTPAPTSTATQVAITLPVTTTATRDRFPGVQEVIDHATAQAQAQTQQALANAQAMTQQMLANARQAMAQAQAQMQSAMAGFGQHSAVGATTLPSTP
jgi:RNA polymerase sigma factor (sigma-70 family)